MEQKTITNINSSTPSEARTLPEHAGKFSDLPSLPSHVDVAVIGGGIAGLIAAIVLARHQFKVILLEKKSYPRDKVCGACLNANALATLEALQLTHILDELKAPTLNQVQIQCGPRTVKLPLPAGRAVTRREFDLALATEAVRCGVKVIDNVTASLDSFNADQTARQVKIQSSHNVRIVDASLVLVAAGLGGIREMSQPWPAKVQPNSKIGMGLSLQATSHNLQPHTIHLCVRQQGYLGLVLAEENRLNLAAAIQPDFLKQQRDFGSWVRATLDQYDLQIEHPLETADWRGTPTLTRRIQKPFGRRWLAIGDSAGYVEPFTGEGMAWAMAGGAIAAQLAADNLDNWTQKHEERWGELYQEMIRHRQWSCRSLAWLLQNRYRSRLAIEAATWFPGIGRWFVNDINQKAFTQSLISTSTTT